VGSVPEHSGNSGAAQRGASEPVALADLAVQWMEKLPRQAQPFQTAARFPRIVNELAGLWQTPQRCRAYFDQLLLDHRGDRQGFPLPIASELAALKDYYDSVVHPTQQTVWDEILNRSHG